MINQAEGLIMISTRQKYDMTMLRKCPSCGSNNLVYTQSGIDKYGMPEHHSIKCRDCECSLHGSTRRFVFEKWNELDRTVDNLSKMFKSGQNSGQNISQKNVLK